MTLKRVRWPFAVAKRNDEYSVWRELLSDDPEDLIAEKAPEFFVERYGEVGPVPGACPRAHAAPHALRNGKNQSDK